MMTIQEIIEKYQSEALKKRPIGYFKTFEIFFADRPINKQTINAWIVDGLNKRLEKPYKSETLYTKYSLLRAAYMYCEQCGEITNKENPFTGHILPPQIKQAFKRMRKAEYLPIKIIHDVIEQFLYGFLKGRSEIINIRQIAILAYFTGMRINEVCSLKWEQIKTNWIYLSDTKERVPRSVALEEGALSEIQSVRKQKGSPYVFPNSKNPALPVSSKVVSYVFIRHWKKFQKTCPEANFHFSFKLLRTAYIQKAQYNGHSIEGIKKQVGHRSVYITDYSYNGSACERSMDEFRSNPRNEIIEKISGILRREIDVDDVRAIDIDLFIEKVKELIRSCRGIHHVSTPKIG